MVPQNSSLHHGDSFVTCADNAAFADTILENGAEQPNPQREPPSLIELPRLWKRSVVSSLQDAVRSRVSPRMMPRRQAHTNGIEQQEEPHWTASMQSRVSESFQTSVQIVTAPLKSLPLPSCLRQEREPATTTCEQEAQAQRQSRLHTFRPFKKSREAPIHITAMNQALFEAMSVRELNATIVTPVYQQSSPDILAVILTYCSGWVEAGLAVLVVLIPNSLLLKWWYLVVDSWPIALLYSWWLWLIHTMHVTRRQAHRGQDEHASRVVAGAALAVFQSVALPHRSSQPRRSKRKRRRMSMERD